MADELGFEHGSCTNGQPCELNAGSVHLGAEASPRAASSIHPGSRGNDHRFGGGMLVAELIEGDHQDASIHTLKFEIHFNIGHFITVCNYCD